MIVSRKRPSEGNYEKEKDLCIKYFDQWSESDQVEFVEHLISRMCHYQHGHINSYLKPMLQRDFITALPGNKHCIYKSWMDKYLFYYHLVDTGVCVCVRNINYTDMHNIFDSVHVCIISCKCSIG